MKVICAWCKKLIGTKDGEGNPAVTHGICPDCYQREIDELERCNAASEVGAGGELATD